MERYFNMVIYLTMFALSFYCLSGIDLGAIMLPGRNRAFKGQMLLWLCSLALGYLAGSFILAITSRI
ncbi:MAG: DUF1146 domain-containing protein [Erysipelotrichaceae bacterium]|nr:DUF1146 domain-containing protein [Erysipelotrichaceae bacterium]